MFWIILIAILLFGYWLINRGVENHKHWQYSFDSVQFSADEFYKSVEEELRMREIPGTEYSRVTYSEGGMFSDNREYLHIVRGEHIFDICAAPFGTCFFVSSWFCEKPGVTKKILRKVKALAPFVESNTYYEIDTAGMFSGAVRLALMESIDAMTTSKGARALSESERALALVA